MLIVHATDLSGDDKPAFVHATAIAAASGARLVTLHGNAAGLAPSALPNASVLAKRWGRDVMHERRCHDCCDDVADTVLDALRTLEPDLVVLGTHGRHGFAALAHPSVEEAITRNIATPVLVVPNTCRGFVDAATGALDLSRVVIAATAATEVKVASDAASFLTGLSTSVVHQSLETEPEACLIVVASHGHDRIGDVLFGSRAERVVRDSGCPVLVVPVSSR